MCQIGFWFSEDNDPERNEKKCSITTLEFHFNRNRQRSCEELFGMATLPKATLSPIRVLVANGHTLFREGLCRLLEAGGFEVVGDTADGESVAALAERTRADVILLDLEMPRRNAIEILRALSTSVGTARTILLTSDSYERAQVVQALKLGAYGVIPQESTTQRLFESIRCVMDGQYWIGKESLSDVVKALRTDSPPEAPRKQTRFGLTPRELEIVALVVAGYSNPDIAQKFSISGQTVKHHVSNIFDKLGVSNRLELALFAVNHQLTTEVG
jgi:two-component system, NarL family, nitrate/nitrite response regulator NarL